MSEITDYVIDSSHLLVLPEVYMSVKQALEDPDMNMSRLAELISTDPAIATRMLKAANSPIYGQVARIDSITRAITVLGTSTVHDLVLATSVAQSFRGLSSDCYDIETFWRDSLMRASVARACAADLNLMDNARYFVIGLLSEIGHMLMGIREPELLQRVMEQHHKTGHPLYLYERSSFGFDYGELGARVLESWSIPASIVQPIRYQNCPEISPDHRTAAAITYCAGRLHPEEDQFPSIIDIETLGQCEITRINSDSIRIAAQTSFQQAADLFAFTRFKEAV